jgi:glycosyltransferase involved in cell wall biosynthesis
MISVIIPSYNHEKYIGRCIESVLNQTFQNFELIIIDDASKDKSWEIINSFSDERICSYKLPFNHGSYYAQNMGIELAKYDYVSILNSDDFYFENRLAMCLSFIEGQDVDFVGTNIELIDSDDHVINENWWTNSFDFQKSLLKQYNNWFRSLFAGNIFMTTSNFFFRKRIFHEIGGFNNLKYVLDYDFLLRSLFGGVRFQWVDEPLLKYRLHDKNTISSKPLEVNKEASKLIRKFITNLPFNDKYVGESIKEGINQLKKFERHIEQTLLFDKNKALSVLKKLITQRDRWVSDRDCWIGERDDLISQRDKWIADRDGWITERDELISQRDKWIADRDSWIGERDELISQRDDEIHKLAKKLEEINSSLAYKVIKLISILFRFFKSNQ